VQVGIPQDLLAYTPARGCGWTCWASGCAGLRWRGTDPTLAAPMGLGTGITCSMHGGMPQTLETRRSPFGGQEEAGQCGTEERHENPSARELFRCSGPKRVWTRPTHRENGAVTGTFSVGRYKRRRWPIPLGQPPGLCITGL